MNIGEIDFQKSYGISISDVNKACRLQKLVLPCIEDLNRVIAYLPTKEELDLLNTMARYNQSHLANPNCLDLITIRHVNKAKKEIASMQNNGIIPHSQAIISTIPANMCSVDIGWAIEYSRIVAESRSAILIETKIKKLQEDLLAVSHCSNTRQIETINSDMKEKISCNEIPCIGLQEKLYSLLGQVQKRHFIAYSILRFFAILAENLLISILATILVEYIFLPAIKESVKRNVSYDNSNESVSCTFTNECRSIMIANENFMYLVEPTDLLSYYMETHPRKGSRINT